LSWVGGYLTAAGARLTTADALAAAPSLSPQTLADFRSYAARQGVTVPAGASADAWLQRALVLRIAAAKWGDAGYYRVGAAVDPEVDAALHCFDRASAILSRR
jgi:carboxyl-terminal processing protease